MTSVQEKDLQYCRAVLATLKKLEANEAQYAVVQAHYEQGLKRSRDQLTFAVAILAALIFVAVLLMVHETRLVLIISFLLAFLLAACLHFWLWNRGRFAWTQRHVQKARQHSLYAELEKLERQKLALNEELTKDGRIPQQYCNSRDVQLLIRYFERQEVNALSDALYFLSLDVKADEQG